MSKRQGRSKWTLPLVVDPPTTICYLVRCPNDVFHRAAFLGALYALSKPRDWAEDSDRTGVAAAEVWRRIFYSLRAGECSTRPLVIEELEYQLSICEQLRIENGKLQALCCGEWTDIAGQEGSLFGGPGQPGDGAIQPQPGGGIACYQAALNGSGLFYLPSVVNTGDVITITEATGAWHDGSFSAWRCPDGNLFFAGGCITTTYTDGADPLPTQPHMSVIAKIGATFYPVLLGSPFTVPAGITDQGVTFQANDSNLADNAGDVAFKLCLTNNKALSFSHTFNLRTDPGPFHLGAIGFYGVYTPGTGFVASAWGPDGTAHYHEGIAVVGAFPARVLTKIRFKGDLVRGTTVSTSIVTIGIPNASGAQLNVQYAFATDGNDQVWEWNGSVSMSSTGFYMENGVDNVPPGGSGRIYELTIEGAGSDPF